MKVFFVIFLFKIFCSCLFSMKFYKIVQNKLSYFVYKQNYLIIRIVSLDNQNSIVCLTSSDYRIEFLRILAIQDGCPDIWDIYIAVEKFYYSFHERIFIVFRLPFHLLDNVICFNNMNNFCMGNL